METVYLLLGSNIGERQVMLQNAAGEIGKSIGNISEKSAVYETEPWGFSDENNFFNQVVVVQTRQTPEQILDHIKKIENRLGRERTDSNGYSSRSIDIDILFYSNRLYKTEQLTIPHPLLQERKFTLLPLQELASDFVHPGYKKTIRQLLQECPDQSYVRRLD